VLCVPAAERESAGRYGEHERARQRPERDEVLQYTVEKLLPKVRLKLTASVGLVAKLDHHDNDYYYSLFGYLTTLHQFYMLYSVNGRPNANDG
jgi:hypothetical protein